MIASGKKAPAFKLPDENGEQLSLSDLKGETVVLYFYPKASNARLHDAGLRRARPPQGLQEGRRARARRLP